MNVSVVRGGGGRGAGGIDLIPPRARCTNRSIVKQSGQKSIKAGVLGDERFADAVLVRPQMINSIISQGYTMLWSDSDVIWLNNPLPLLPQVGPDSNVSDTVNMSSHDRT